jgi:putative inorganic carbon (HCO3(-)) transporter
VRPQSIYESLDVLPFALLGVLLTAGFWFLDRAKTPVKNAVDTQMILFTAAVLLSTAFAYAPSEALRNISLPLSWALIYVLISRVINSDARFFIAFLLYLMFSFKMSQHGFRSWASRGFAFEDWGVVGAPGWFSNSGEFGIQMAIFLPLSAMFYAAYYKNWGWVTRGLVALMPFTALASVLASSSRGALVGSAIGAAWLVLSSRHRWKALITLVVVMTLAYFFLPPEFAARFDSAGTDSTSLSRLERWTAGIDAFKDNPIFGVGYDNWLAYYPAHYTITIGGSLLMHNMFIQAASELGLVGLIPLAALILLCFVNTAQVRAFARAADREDLVLLSRGFDAATIGFLVSAAFVTVLFYPFLWIHVAFIVAFRSVAQRLPARAREQAATPPEARVARRMSTSGRARVGVR